jgi:hypothetical protein
MPADGDKSGPSSLDGLQAVVGLLAGVAALIYVTGGLVLALRLSFAGLPSIAVVGQLPRGFLFSLGATQVVAPAIVIGAVVGLLDLGQNAPRRLRFGHLPWWYAKNDEGLRKTYIRFYGVAPAVLIAPAAAYALAHAPKVGRRGLLFAVLGLALLAGIWSLATAWRSSGIIVTSEQMSDVKALEGRNHDLPDGIHGAEWAWISAGALWALVGAIWIRIGSSSETWSYFSLLGAWLAALLMVLLLVWLRGVIGQRARAVQTDTLAGLTMLTILSWGATALVAVPGLVALAAALPLESATACAPAVGNERATTIGRLVGETSDRVYIGDTQHHRILAIRTDDVPTFIFGQNAANRNVCSLGNAG